MPTLGTDCDIILTCPAVNGGVGVGFLLKRTRSEKPTVTIRRGAYLNADGTYQDQIKVAATLIFADNLVDPNGGKHARTRAQDYALYLQFLAARTGITVTTPDSSLTSLLATLQDSVEDITHDVIEATLTLNNGTLNQMAPTDTDRFLNSMWDGPLTWATSYWR